LATAPSLYWSRSRLLRPGGAPAAGGSLLPPGRGAALLFVDGGVVENLLFRDRERVALRVELLEETALVAGVAGAAGLRDFKEEHVAVAIHIPAVDLLRVSAGFALEPELLPGAAPVVHEPGGEGFFESFPVQPGKHEDAAARGAFSSGVLLEDGGNEAI